MNKFGLDRLLVISAISSSLGLIGLALSTASAIAQQPTQLPPNTRLCSTGNQACQGSPANAILSDGPLSVSSPDTTVPDTRVQNVNRTRESVFEQVADSVNEQIQPEEAAFSTRIGPLDLNPRTSPGIGVRDVQD